MFPFWFFSFLFLYDSFPFFFPFWFNSFLIPSYSFPFLSDSFHFFFSFLIPFFSLSLNSLLSVFFFNSFSFLSFPLLSVSFFLSIHVKLFSGSVSEPKRVWQEPLLSFPLLSDYFFSFFHFPCSLFSFTIPFLSFPVLFLYIFFPFWLFFLSLSFISFTLFSFLSFPYRFFSFIFPFLSFLFISFYSLSHTYWEVRVVCLFFFSVFYTCFLNAFLFHIFFFPSCLSCYYFELVLTGVIFTVGHYSLCERGLAFLPKGEHRLSQLKRDVNDFLKLVFMARGYCKP